MSREGAGDSHLFLVAFLLVCFVEASGGQGQKSHEEKMDSEIANFLKVSKCATVG